MGLFNFGKKKSAPQTSAASTEKLENGELPWGWVTRHQSWFEPKNKAIASMTANLANTKTTEQRIHQLQALIEYFYAYKQEAHQKGECFEKYFDDMWMHCHNSRNPDFVFIAPYEAELQKLQG